MQVAWKKHGPIAMDIVAKEEPARFLQICASLMPKDVALDAKIDLRAQTNEWLGWLRDPHILAAMQAKTIDAQPVEGVLPPKQEALPPPEPAQQPRYQGTPAKPEYSRHPRARLAPQSPHINADYDMPSEKRSGFDSAIPYGKKSDGV